LQGFSTLKKLDRFVERNAGFLERRYDLFQFLHGFLERQGCWIGKSVQGGTSRAAEELVVFRRGRVLLSRGEGRAAIAHRVGICDRLALCETPLTPPPHPCPRPRGFSRRRRRR